MSQDAEMMVQTGRFEIKPAVASTLPRRYLIWFGVQTAATLLLSTVIPRLGPAEYALCIAMGLGASFTRLASLPWSPLVVAVSLLAVAVSNALGQNGLPAGAAIIGAALALLEPDGRRPWKVAATGLTLAALAPAAWWMAHVLGDVVPHWLELGGTAAFYALVCALVLAVPSLSWRPVARIPSLGRIRADLKEPYRGPCERAWELDQSVSRYTPDRETRDGLGEVAAWIYRLSSALQVLDQELEKIPLDEIQRRIETASQAIEGTDDVYTRERRQATLRHLEGLKRHRDALVLERQRTESLVDYALATLEEARTSLVTSRQIPGHTVPEGIDEVLGRLRSYSAQEEARRNTALELDKVP